MNSWTEPHFEHPLRVAHTYCERAEKAKLDSFFEHGSPKVLCVYGPGGTGKSTLAGQFVCQHAKSRSYEAMFVWSFYENKNVNDFFSKAVDYFSQGKLQGAADPKDRLLDRLADRGRYLLVLDGMEKLQRREKKEDADEWPLSEHLLHDFLVAASDSPGEAQILITTRHNIADMPALGGVYGTLPLRAMKDDERDALLDSYGVSGSDPVIKKWVSPGGAIALSIDLLGSLLSSASRSPKLPTKADIAPYIRNSDKLTDEERAVEETRFRVFVAHERHLRGSHGEATPKLDALRRVCLFRSGITPDTLADIFKNVRNADATGTLNTVSKREFGTILGELLELRLVIETNHNLFNVHDTVRDFFYDSWRRDILGLGGSDDVPNCEKSVLQALEDIVLQALDIGHYKAAYDVYLECLGSYTGMGMKCAEMERGYRVTEAFLKDIVRIRTMLGARSGELPRADEGSLPHQVEEACWKKLNEKQMTAEYRVGYHDHQLTEELDKTNVARLLNAKAGFARDLGALYLSGELFYTARDFASSIQDFQWNDLWHDPRNSLVAYRNLAGLEALRGRLREAEFNARQGLEIVRLYEHKLEVLGPGAIPITWVRMANVRSFQGSSSEAADLWTKAVVFWNKHPDEVDRGYLEYAVRALDHWLRSGDLSNARHVLANLDDRAPMLRPCFDADPVFIADLDRGLLPDNMLRLFEKERLMLQGNTGVLIDTPTNKWLVLDESMHPPIIVHLRNDHLSVAVYAETYLRDLRRLDCLRAELAWKGAEAGVDRKLVASAVQIMLTKAFKWATSQQDHISLAHCHVSRVRLMLEAAESQLLEDPYNQQIIDRLAVPLDEGRAFVDSIGLELLSCDLHNLEARYHLISGDFHRRMGNEKESKSAYLRSLEASEAAFAKVVASARWHRGSREEREMIEQGANTEYAWGRAEANLWQGLVLARQGHRTRARVLLKSAAKQQEAIGDCHVDRTRKAIDQLDLA